MDMQIDYTKITDRQQKVIDEIMDNFDFNKVERHMIHAQWGWTRKAIDEDGEQATIYKIPDQFEIKKALRTLMQRAFNNLNAEKQINPDNVNPMYISCGGFTVYVWPNDTCQAYFSVEEWWVDSEDIDSK